MEEEGEEVMAVNIHQGCSLEAMKSMKDNQYDLAVVDPPYGIQETGNISRKTHKPAFAKSSAAASTSSSGASRSPSPTRLQADIAPVHEIATSYDLSRNSY